MANVLISFDTLLGKKVIGVKGYMIGEIKGASINTKSWEILALHVKLADTAAEELGFKKRFGSSTVCMPVKFIKAVADVVTVTPSLAKLGESKEITECKE